MDCDKFGIIFSEEGRWIYHRECLNIVNINKPPVWYKGNDKEWIEDITSYAIIYPVEWEVIYKEYCYLVQTKYKEVNQNRELEFRELEFRRSEDGYLRKIGEKDIYLAIHLRIKKKDAVKMAEKICSYPIMGYYSYLQYCTFSNEKKLEYLNILFVLILDRIIYGGGDKKMLQGIYFRSSYEDCEFEGNEIFVDVLGNTYCVL